MTVDKQTADAFATSWNNLPQGSVYTVDQFVDWFSPLRAEDVVGKKVLELGCGNGSLLSHMASWKPGQLVGVDLGDSVISCEKNMQLTGFSNYKIIQSDLTKFQGDGFDVAYCIGVIHHLKEPEQGFQALINNTVEGGKFHGWVYAREGNAVVVYLVDPIRIVASRLPWWFTKYFLATPLAALFYIYANVIRLFKNVSFVKKLPLFEYSCWISNRGFLFFRHVAFDQLVTPQTAYIPKKTIEDWLSSDDRIDPSSVYIIFRNGNSWKFGGNLK